MYYTYVLINERKFKYIGYTNNLKRRFKEHNNNEVYTTRKIGGKWKLIYYEACLKIKDAKSREKYLKSGRGSYYLKRRLKNYL